MCDGDFMFAEEHILDAAKYLDQYLQSHSEEDKKNFMDTCFNHTIEYNLNTTIGYINMEPRIPGCNIIDRMYEASPYGTEGSQRNYTGYRDYYM